MICVKKGLSSVAERRKAAHKRLVNAPCIPHFEPEPHSLIRIAYPADASVPFQDPLDKVKPQPVAGALPVPGGTESVL